MSETAEVETPVSTIESPAAAPAAPALKALVVVGAAKPVAGYDLVIAAEGRLYAEDGASPGPVRDGYAKGADLYLRISPEVSFPAKAEVVTLGVELKQLMFWGFTRQPGFLNVGPALPAYAAANLAYQRGATTIDIVGLTAGEKERLQIFIDHLPTAVEPAQVAVSFL